jgi:hypothetical protein
MSIKNLAFNRHVTFTGRNGTMKCAGVELMEFDDRVQISPITSKGDVGRCDIDIPKENVPALIEALAPKKPDVFVLFWVYGDGDDTPYIIRNPPRNLGKLLKEWNALDAKMVGDPEGTGDLPEGWDYVNKWLKKRGVDIFPAKREVRLDDHQPE